MIMTDKSYGIPLVSTEEIEKGRNYTKEELLEYLRKFEKKEGRSPEETDFNKNPKYPSFNTYVKHFGSWNNALTLAGLQTNVFTNTTIEELLGYLRKFEREKGRPPGEMDFRKNPKYPSLDTYTRRFGNWNNALKMVGLDIDSRVRKGIVKTTKEKARLAEIFVIEHFPNKGAVDLSGKNCKSPYDGICPKNQTYDVKSSKLYDSRYFNFGLINTYRYKIEWYYLLGFNEDYSELKYAWRIPFFDFVDIDNIVIWINNNYLGRYNLENMRQYETTDKILPIFNSWLDKIKGKKHEI